MMQLKFFRVTLAAILILFLVAPSDSMAYRHIYFKHKGPYRVTANSAILWDPVTNQRYYDLRADHEVFPASTTKVLTAILVLENLPLDKFVTVSPHATQVPPTKLGLRAGESYRVRDLLYGLILKSANDAAVVLAEAVGGSEEKFVEMMNARAAQLGATHSHFANPHGLPSVGPQFTTAADMALMFNAALKNEFFRAAITFKYHVICSKDGRQCFLKSHNKALFFRWREHVFGKTGFTFEAQSCFVGYVPHGNDILIIAVYGCRKRWTDMKYILEHYGHVNL
jgi:D-alanyl-D-alanine carboxypeptidase (penicillin-binding protein 5/6)